MNENRKESVRVGSEVGLWRWIGNGKETGSIGKEIGTAGDATTSKIITKLLTW